MHWLAWLAHESANKTDGTEQLYQKWEGRADKPNYHYAGRDLVKFTSNQPFHVACRFNRRSGFVDREVAN